MSATGRPGQFADRAKRQAAAEQGVEPGIAEGVEPRRLLRDRGQRRRNAVGQLRLDLTLQECCLTLHRMFALYSLPAMPSVAHREAEKRICTVPCATRRFCSDALGLLYPAYFCDPNGLQFSAVDSRWNL